MGITPARLTSDPVIVAGAGPVGCTAALALAQAGIPVLLIEREIELAEDLRASTIHPSSLDLLDTLGVTERIFPMGLPAPVYQYRDRQTGDRIDFDLGVLADHTRFPMRLQCEQFKLTRVIVEMLKAYSNATVRLGMTVTGLEQDDAGVTLTVKNATGEGDVVRGSYVIGCDGSTSTIRKASGIDFEGFTYPEKFLVIGSPIDYTEYLPGLANVSYVADPNEWCALVRVVGSWRVVFPMETEKSDEELLMPDHVDRLLKKFVPIKGAYEIFHRAIYRVHQRVASTFNQGRVLLAGDAAHLNNPLGGMGMNSGIHDAFNVAEKLVQIEHDGASPDILDRYTRQRRMVAVEYVQSSSIRNKRLLEERDAAVRKQHFEELRQTATDPIAAREYLLRSTLYESLERANAVT
jgi:3-(3-hydroxy-phenyl)propionate hydroxylase